MTNTINEYFVNAQLSLGAYASLYSGIGTDDYVRALKLAGMADPQAQEFARTYIVVDQRNDPSGFSATVFMKGNDFFFAIRGTNDVGDVLADIDLALGTGIASNQTLAMYNYFQRLITPSDSQALQVTYVFPTLDEFGNVISPGGFQRYSANGLGYISDPGTIFTVSGHSLGGHLGMAFGRLFGSNVSQLYAYNAPGFDEASANNFFDQLNAAVGLGNDTYIWNKGDGFDAITDAHEADGFKQGSVQFLNQSLTGTKTQVSPDNPVEFSDGLGVTYQFFGPEGGEGTLFISKAGEAGDLEVRGFRSGDFGIDLGPVAAIQKTDKLGTADADNGADPGSPIYNDAPDEKLYGLDGDDGFLITMSGTEAYLFKKTA